MASIPGYWSYKIISYEMNGTIVTAEYNCMSKATCSTDYKVELSHDEGMSAVSKVIPMKIGRGKRNWPLRLKAGDSIKKEKWSNEFCINDKCKKKPVIGNLIFSFILYVVVGWLIRIDVARQRGLGEESHERNPG